MASYQHVDNHRSDDHRTDEEKRLDAEWEIDLIRFQELLDCEMSDEDREIERLQEEQEKNDESDRSWEIAIIQFRELQYDQDEYEDEGFVEGYFSDDE